MKPTNRRWMCCLSGSKNGNRTASRSSNTASLSKPRGKTAKSILVSVGVRLAAFNLPQINRLTMTDELHLDELGEQKVAQFCCIPDSDKSLNYLVGMVYAQLIQTLYRQADRVHKGRLPVPVHCLMDEFANISLPKDSFLSALATMRSPRHVLLDHRAEHLATQSSIQGCETFRYKLCLTGTAKSDNQKHLQLRMN